MTETESNETEGTVEFVSLVAGGQGFCIEITSIREIRRWSSVTPLPNSDPAVLGVMNLRGSVIPIVDLAIQLGLKNIDLGERSVIVVSAIGEKVVGLLVDTVSEILSVENSQIQNNPTNERDGSTSQIVGLLSVDDTMFRVLDLESLLENEREGALT